MGLDKPGRDEEKVEKVNETNEGSTEQASEKLIADNRSEEKKGAVQATDDRAQTPDSTLKVLPRVDMYDFHQGGSRPVNGDRGLSPAAQAQAQAEAKAKANDASAQNPDVKPDAAQNGKAPNADQIRQEQRPAEKLVPDQPAAQSDANAAQKGNAPNADQIRQEQRPAEKLVPDQPAAQTDAKPAKDGATDQQPEAKPEQEKPKDGMTAAEAAHMNAFREKMEKENFNLKAIEKGWGPYQALEAMVKEGKIKMTPAEMKAEAERIRNREFKELGRQHFKVGESPKRWSQEEMDKMAQGELKNFRDAEEKRVAAEKKAEEERQQAAAEKQLRDQTAVALEKHVPAQDKLQNAAKGIGLNISEEQIKEFRDRLKEHTFKEIARGTMKQEDLERPMPRVGGVFVAIGAVKEEQLNEAVQKQEEMRKAGQKPPQLGDMLREQLKGNNEALARLELASKFYDKLYEEVTGKPRVAPAAPADKAQQTQPAPPEKQPDPKLKVRR